MTIKDDLDIYLDPMSGYWGKDKMLKKFRMKLNNLVSQQRHRRITKPMREKQFRRISASHPFEAVQLDLAFLPKLRSPLNHNVWGFIVVIDVFSRYLWIKTFTNRKSLHIPIESILKQMKTEFGRTPNTMTADNEFATLANQQLAADYNFKWYFADANEKYRTGLGERVIGTLKNLIKRYLTQNNTTKYIDVLSALVYNYNDTIHKATNTRPSVAIRTGQTFPKPFDKEIKPLKVGDKVRILEKRTKFTKGDAPYYSKDVYEVSGRDKNRYVLINPQTGHELVKRFGRHQLYKINDVNKSKYNDIDDNDGYDEGIAKNTARNQFNAAMNRHGIPIVDLNDDDRQEAMEHQMDVSNIAQPAESEDFGRIDDLSTQWDKLHVNKYKKQPTSANGACFFNALAGVIHYEKNKQIIPVGSAQEKHTSNYLRKKIVQYMKNNLNKKIPILNETIYDNITRQLSDENDSRDINTYLNDMLKTSEWAGQSEIIGASLYLKRNILVYILKNPYYIKHGGYIYDENDNDMITLFWNKKHSNLPGTHYEYLLPIPHQPSTDIAPRRSRRVHKPVQQYQPPPKRNVPKILPKEYKDKDGNTAEYWGEENIDNWVEDKRKDGWLWIRKIKGEMRYRGVYDRLDDDIFITGSDDEDEPPKASNLKPTKAQLKDRHRKKRERRKLRNKINNIKNKNNLSNLIANL